MEPWSVWHGRLVARACCTHGTGAHIENMTDRSLGKHAYCLVELGSEVDENVIGELSTIEGVYRARSIRRRR